MGGPTAACGRSHCRLWAAPLPPVGGPTATYGWSHCCLWAVPLPPVCVFVCLCMCVYACVCVFVWTKRVCVTYIGTNCVVRHTSKNTGLYDIHWRKTGWCDIHWRILGCVTYIEENSVVEFTYTLFYTPPLPEVADETQKRIWRQNEFPIGVFQVFHLAMKE